MKKISFISILLVLALLVTGCSKPTITQTQRWNVDIEPETHTYDIRVIDSLNTLVAGKVVSADRPTLHENTDQVKPLSAVGKYVTKIENISVEDKKQKYSTDLSLVETYSVNGLSQAFINQVIEAGIATLSKDGLELSITTTIASYTEYNSGNWQPISSSRSVQGVYVGKARQVYNHYNIFCNYDYTGKKYICKSTFSNYLDTPTKVEKEITFTGKVYDNNMLFLIMRTFSPAQLNAGTPLPILEPLQNDKVMSLQLKSAETDRVTLTGSVGEGDNKVEGISNEFALFALATQGMSMGMWCEKNQTKIFMLNPVNTYVPVKIQYGYLVLTLNASGLAELGVVNKPEVKP
ncbi:MAG: hypothetical protein RR248_01155 [Clostridia bacterium]